MNIGTALGTLSIIVALAPLGVACSGTSEPESEQMARTDQAVSYNSFEIVYQSVSNKGYVTGPLSTMLTYGNMMPGTSPSITGLSPNVGWKAAYQADTGYLWLNGVDGKWTWGNTGYGMMAGTSPSIAGLTSGGYEAAFQANTGNLWITGTAGTGDTGYGMKAGTSPSITALAGGGYEVVFQANTGDLWIYGTAGTGNTGYGMKAGTSPSITALTSGGYEAVFQANTGYLWIYGTAGTGDTGYGMMAGTSPSIAGLTSGGYEAAFQANTGNLWITGTAGTGDTGLGMMAGTSPSITALTNGYEAAFQANTGYLWGYGTARTGKLDKLDSSYTLAPGTSPSIMAVPAAPAAPTGLAATSSASNGSATVNLSWTAVSGATGYGLTQTSPSGSLQSQTVKSPNATWASLALNTTYSYVVWACNAYGACSGDSSISKTTPSSSSGGSGSSTTGNVNVYFELETTGTSCGSSNITISGGSLQSALTKSATGQMYGQSRSGQVNSGHSWCYYDATFSAVPVGSHEVCASGGAYYCTTVTVSSGSTASVYLN